MTCLTAQDPEPMMTESLVSLLSHGVRMQALQRAQQAPVSAPTENPPPAQQQQQQQTRQETPEERRRRIRGVLANALKITEDLFEDEDEEDNEIQAMFQTFGASRGRQWIVQNKIYPHANIHTIAMSFQEACNEFAWLEKAFAGVKSYYCTYTLYSPYSFLLLFSHNMLGSNLRRGLDCINY